MKSHLEQFETVFLVVFETKILKNIDIVSKLLQVKQQDIEQASKLFNVSYENIRKMRDDLNLIKGEAENLAREWGTSIQFTKKRLFRPKRFFDEVNSNHYQIQSNEEWFKINVFFKTLVCICMYKKTMYV